MLDVYRTAVAIRLSESLLLTLQEAYDGVDYRKKDEDFTVALPTFRLPGRSKTAILLRRVSIVFTLDQLCLVHG